ncbi:MAG: YceI family protein [Burkholderiales bacterium]
MKKTLLLFLAALALSSAFAQQKLVPAQSEIVFVSKQLGVPVDGKFKKFDAQIAFDTKKPETGKINFAIDLGSAEIGDAETIKELKKPDWFSVVKFPQATFASSAIKAVGPGKYEVSGTLSIKGNTKPVVVPVTLVQTGTTGLAQGSFVLKRNDFQIGAGEWADVSIVANDVTVKFKLALAGL